MLLQQEPFSRFLSFSRKLFLFQEIIFSRRKVPFSRKLFLKTIILQESFSRS